MALRGGRLTFKINDAKLMARLKEFEPKLRKKAMNKALRAGTKEVLPLARRNAPKRSGKLKKTVKVRAGKRSRRGKHIVTILLSTSKTDNLFEGAAFYGGFQEFGWKLGKRSGSGRKSQRRLINGRWVTLRAGKKIAGKHFIERAYKARGQSALNTIMRHLRDSVDILAATGNI